MKNAFYRSVLLTAFAATACFGIPCMSMTPAQGPTKVVLKKLPKNPKTGTVKLVPGAPAPIDAWVEGETLSLTFFADLGEAEVTVSSDMSAWSVTETFDTADGTLLLTVDTEPDNYTITVTTSDASYIGGYSVE